MALLVLGAFRRLLPRRIAAVCAKPVSAENKKTRIRKQGPGDGNLSLGICASTRTDRFVRTILSVKSRTVKRFVPGACSVFVTQSRNALLQSSRICSAFEDEASAAIGIATQNSRPES